MVTKCSMEQVFIAMLVDNFLYPVSAFRSHFSQSINWSGIRYHLKDGKISKVCILVRAIHYPPKPWFHSMLFLFCRLYLQYSSEIVFERKQTAINGYLFNWKSLHFITDWPKQGQRSKIYRFGMKTFIREERSSAQSLHPRCFVEKFGPLAPGKEVRCLGFVFINKNSWFLLSRDAING